jgi:hypothetical protein
MKIVLEIGLTSSQRRIVRGAVVVATVIATLGVGVVIAAPSHTWKAGEPLSAAQLNETLVDIDRRAHLLSNGTSTYSVGATRFCGKTPLPYSGKSIEGYSGAKQKCEKVASCSPSAHLCSEEEVVRSLAVGIDLGLSPNAWIHGSGSVGANVAANATNNDCNGFTEGIDTAPAGTSGFYGRVFSVNTNGQLSPAPFTVVCETKLPLLCCD